MADDPNRDLLPVKEGSCIGTCLTSTIDTRNRHAVLKLDRYELEDRYLQMRDEVQELKKLTNTQEDKIKRLVTKLMRVSASPGSCLETALDCHDSKSCRENLEIENAKLKDKINVLRNQILNHKIGGRSPSRNRRLQICSSGPTTCRSDTGRIRSSTSHLMRDNDRDDEKPEKNNLDKIEELEMEKKSLTSRIEDLESQLANFEAGNQRKKVAENVEFIRVWRQMKLQSEELVTCQARNASLEEQIGEMKDLVDEKSRNIKEITNALLSEKKKLADMGEQLTRAKNSQLTLREKNDQIKDLMNEMKILRQHNAELIALSSKYSNAEIENMELRKKISEQLSDNLSLKSAFSNEQANITALQAANQQLIGKLHDLQTHIDTLTIQLKSFQSQNEKQEKFCLNNRRTLDRQTNTDSIIEKQDFSSEKHIRLEQGICKNCCQSRETYDRKSPTKHVTCGVQTDTERTEVRKNSMAQMIAEKKSPKHFVPRSTICDRYFQHENGNLTPEEMIELLEKAQINTPLDAQNIARLRRVEKTSTKNCVNTSDSRQMSSPPAKKKSCQSLDNDPWKILLVLYKILRENVASSSKILENFDSCICDDDDERDENNNNARTFVECQREGYGKNIENKPLGKRNSANDRRRTPSSHFVGQCTEPSDCCCEDNEECSYEVDCGYPCVPSISAGELIRHEEEFDNCQCKIARDSFKNFVGDFNTSIQKTFDNIHRSRITRVDGASPGLYKSWQKACESRSSINRSCNEIDSKFTVCRRARCLFRGEKIDETMYEKIRQYGIMRFGKNFDDCIEEDLTTEDFPCVSRCKKKRVDESIEDDSKTFPILITNDQGLLEIHIVCLQLTAMATNIIREEINMNDLSLFVTWNLWNKEEAFTPSLKYPKLNVNSTSIHRVINLFKFFDRVVGETISFRIHITRGGNVSRPIARARLSIEDILHYPQNKFYYVIDFSSTLPCSRDKNFGQLSLWIRLNCDLKRLETFKKQRGIYRRSPIDDKSRKLENKAKNNRRSSQNSNEKKKYETIALNRGTSSRSINAHEEKDIPRSPGTGNEHDFHSTKLGKISRLSEESGIERLTSGTSSSTLERSFVNGKSLNKIVADDSREKGTKEASIVERLSSSMMRAVEDDDTTSEEFINEVKEHDKGDSGKSLIQEEAEKKRENENAETESVSEFNNMIHDDTILSPSGSRSSVQDLGTVFTDVNWQRYRKRSVIAQAKSLGSTDVPIDADGRGKTFHLLSDDSTSSCDALILRIESLTLFPECSLLDNPEIHQLYVEFSFLGYRGAEMETISVPKPSANTKAYFNYMRKFELDEEQNAAQRKILRDIMAEDESPSIKFIVVSEPLTEEMETKECEEVGYAHFNIRDHILRGSSKDATLTIMNVKRTQPIGNLKITLLGAEAIRRSMSNS